MSSYILAKDFIQMNARPLDKARWNYLFEGGSQEDVIIALQAYQNDDGGFAHALEPDCWNENSTPLQTCVATRIIKEIHLEDKDHPLIQGILKYLASQKEFDGFIWNGLNTVKSNNYYPHAPWWSYNKTQELSYNPTASLIGFILKFADKDTQFYKQTCQMALDAFDYFKENHPLESMHETSCFVELYDYLKECSIEHLVNMKEFNELLHKQIKHVLNDEDKDKWNTEYTCKPSMFIKNKNSDFYLDNKKMCKYEYKFIKKNQNLDGTWNITWKWEKYPEQWYISKNWWKSDIIIHNMKYIKEFE